MAHLAGVVPDRAFHASYCRTDAAKGPVTTLVLQPHFRSVSLQLFLRPQPFVALCAHSTCHALMEPTTAYK